MPSAKMVPSNRYKSAGSLSLLNCERQDTEIDNEKRKSKPFYDTIHLLSSLPPSTKFNERARKRARPSHTPTVGKSVVTKVKKFQCWALAYF